MHGTKGGMRLGYLLSSIRQSPLHFTSRDSAALQYGKVISPNNANRQLKAKRLSKVEAVIVSVSCRRDCQSLSTAELATHVTTLVHPLRATSYIFHYNPAHSFHGAYFLGVAGDGNRNYGRDYLPPPLLFHCLVEILATVQRYCHQYWQ
jgi:hypothetical protein